MRAELKPGDKNVLANPLILRDKIIFPLLIIKMWFVKQFIKTIDKESKRFECLGNTLTGIGVEKNENFRGPDISLNQKKFFFFFFFIYIF